ncbi:MAG TPA: type II toxin-antitoxin system VapB family antitoxin [Acetobacteraceae bacterium]|nr:type II toxin-antitoxin system VapB family antitoxin [Acetobacteraceae bacterium]
MRLTLDDDLLAKAREMTGLVDTSALVRLALKRLVESEAARRLALLGGSEPEATLAPRRRSRLA